MAKLDQININGTTYEIVPEIAPLFDTTTAYAAGDCVIKDAVLYRFTVAHAAGAWIGTDAEEVTVGKELTGLKADLNEISSMSIDGYDRAYAPTTTTVVTGAYIDINGNPVSTSAWAYCYLDVTPGETYKLSGVAGTGGRLYVVKNANGVVIDTYQSEVNITHQDLEYTIPENGAVLYVNTLASRFAAPIVKKQNNHFIKHDSAGIVSVVNNSGSEYSIVTDMFTHVVDLYGSNNGTFTFKNLNVSNMAFKPVNDDITPINLGTVGYVGANHGYIWVYNCTITSHGLTTADIGKTSTDGTNTWVLLRITDTNTVVVGCYDSTVWFKLKRVAPTTLNFGASDLTVSDATLSQLYPSVKNVSVSIDDSNSEKAVVTETYDIIDVGSGIEAIKNNVGSNTNQSIAVRADSVARINNIYEFQANGAVVIYTSTKILKTDVVTNFVSFIQSGAFTGSDSFWIPEMTSYNGFIPETGAQVDFLKTGWVDANKPPQEYIQTNGNASNSTKAMILGYIINDDDRADNIATTAGFVSAAGKLYPHFVQPNTSIGEVIDFNTISYRIPCSLNSFVKVSGFNLVCNYIFVGNDIYLFINTYLSNGNIDFPLPKFMQGKKVETIMSRNMECQNKVTTTSISIKYAVRGSVILRLYD